MTDLKLGLLEVYGCTVGPDTTPQTLAACLPSEEHMLQQPALQAAFLRCRRPVLVAGLPFAAELYFAKDRPDRIRLRPQIPNQPPERDKAQVMRRYACDAVLQQLLGQPAQKDAAQTIYRLPWGTVTAISHLSLRDEADAGYIILQYDH